MGRSMLRPYFFGWKGEKGGPRCSAGSVRPTISAMPVTLRAHEPRDFAALLRLDQACFPPGIAYSKTMLRYFLKLPSADGMVAEDSGIVGFILTEENPPLAHVITLDVAESHRRKGVGSALLAESEKNLALRGVRTILLETATDNEAGVAFWRRHGYRIEATLKRYYLQKIDAYEMRKILPGTTKTAKHPGEMI
jgi:[ribosomal protein S18]-alanine N-acetyltransferase